MKYSGKRWLFLNFHILFYPLSMYHILSFINVYCSTHQFNDTKVYNECTNNLKFKHTFTFNNYTINYNYIIIKLI